MTVDLTMTMRDVFHKLTTTKLVLDASYTTQDNVAFSDTNDFFVMLADVCKRADEGVIIPFTDKSYPTRILVSHVWNYKQIELKMDNGTFSTTLAVRYSWNIESVLRGLESRFIAAWSQHLERIGQRSWYDNGHVFNFVEWLSRQENDKITVLVPPSPIWGKPSIQRITDTNTYEEVTGNYRDAHTFLTSVQETNKGTGVVFAFEKIAKTATTLDALRVNAITTDGQNKLTQSVTWESTDQMEGVVNILSTFFTGTPLKVYSGEVERYAVDDVSEIEKVRTFLDTERPKMAKAEASVIRTTYGSPNFEEDIRNWIMMQAEEMGVA